MPSSSFSIALPTPAPSTTTTPPRGPLASRGSCPRISAPSFPLHSNWPPSRNPPATARHAAADRHGTPATLPSFLAEASSDDMVVLMSHLQVAAKRIAALLASPSVGTAADFLSVNDRLNRNPIAMPSKESSLPAGRDLNSKEGLPESDLAVSSRVGRDAPKPMDSISNDILRDSLNKSRKVAAMASEEDELPTWIDSSGPYVVVFDPLDGSRNIDASIPTGTIFGVYRRLEELDELPNEEKALVNVLQRGERLVAAGYVLYSSATIFCVSVGTGVHAFTLDHTIGEFVLTYPNLTVPQRGQIYSVNDARYFEWPEGLRRYVDNIRQGKGRSAKKYSARYICSLVADFHRTLFYGGVAMNPRDHLRLVYEANPLSFIAEQASGKGSTGNKRILGIQPVELHQRLPLFLGSSEDVSELESYGDVQQLVNPGYEV